MGILNIKDESRPYFYLPPSNIISGIQHTPINVCRRKEQRIRVGEAVQE